MSIRFLRAPVAASAFAALLVVPPASFGQSTPDGRYPVTPGQRHTAEEVAQAGVPLSALAPSAPERYTVQRGDTLWHISSLFLTSPWRWPELWGMNKAQLRNPHLIYPGQTLLLLRDGERARLQLASANMPGNPGDLVHLSPRIRDEGGDGAAIPSIPNGLIEPFLSQPVVVSAGELEHYPRIIATQEDRVNLSSGDTAYARGVPDDAVENYNVFRPATPLIDPADPAHKAIIGYEAHYLGTARVARHGPVASMTIITAHEEVGVGDRLLPVTHEPMIRFAPHRPDKPISGQLVSIYDGSDHAGGAAIVALNRGAKDGLEVGHVLSLLETGAVVRDRTNGLNEKVQLPDESVGELFVFRTFDNISYALIMRTIRAAKAGDRFATPDEALLTR